MGSVQQPPYAFEPPECPTPGFHGYTTISCGTPGLAICKPGAGDPEVESVLCCDENTITGSANGYSELILQRELFDPTAKGISGDELIIKDLMSLRGLKTNAYNAYLRNFKTGTLTAVDVASIVETQSSVVLILKDEDNVNTRNRIAQQLKNRQNILPSRMTWE